MSEQPINGNQQELEGQIEVVELEGEFGNRREFAILEEFDFEDGNRYAFLAPLDEVMALENAQEQEEPDLSVEIFRVVGEDFITVEDPELCKQLLQFIEERTETEGASDEQA